MAISAPLFKTYRVAITFEKARKLKAVKITNTHLMTGIACAVTVDIVICSIYTFLHQTRGSGGRVMNYIDSLMITEWSCNNDDLVNNVQLINAMFQVSLLLILCLFAFRNRKSSKVFKESKCAFFGSFFAAFTFLVIFVFNQLLTTTEEVVHIQSVGVITLIVVIWSLFFGTRIYKFIMYPDKRDEINVTAEPSQTSSQAFQDSNFELSDYHSGSMHGQQVIQQNTNTSSIDFNNTAIPENDTVDELGAIPEGGMTSTQS